MLPVECWLTEDILPTVIQFENNVLSDKKAVGKLVERLSINYNCNQVKFDMVCKLK